MKGSVRKRGDKWSYYFDLGIIEGKRKKKEKGGFRTKKEAEAALRNALAEFENTGSIKAESEISVSDYLDYWYKEYVLLNLRFNTQDLYSRIITIHVKPVIGHYKLKNLSSGKLQELFNTMFKKGLSKSLLRTTKSMLNVAFNMAVAPYELIKSTPLEGVKIPKYEHKVIDNDSLKIVTLEKFKTILALYPYGSEYHIPLQLAFHTGMRVGEVSALRWEDIDLENKILTVNHTLILKGGKGKFELTRPKTKNYIRKISLGTTIIEILLKQKKWQEDNKSRYEEYYFDSDFVCTKEDGRVLTVDKLKYMVKRIREILHIDINFHSFRHTHATLLIEAGANIKGVQERLGHSRITTTMDTYTHVTQRIKTETVDIFENYIQ